MLKQYIKHTGLALSALALFTVATSCTAQDELADAKAALADAAKITVTAPSKDTWFAKNLKEAAKGKVVSVRVNSKATEESIYVEKKDGTAVLICPIDETSASVVTDKDLVAKHAPKVEKVAEEKAASAKASSDTVGKEYKVKNKTVRIGMTKAEVQKILGEADADIGTTDNLWAYDNRNGFFDVAGLKLWKLRFENGRLVGVLQQKVEGALGKF
jgi:hypothetical protein